MPAAHDRHTSSAAAKDHLNELLDEALKDTFPASDPVAIAVDAEPALATHARGSSSGRDDAQGRPPRCGPENEAA
jgi:hypothetical protein